MKNKNEKEDKKMMTNNLNQYIRVEYEKLKTETEQREFVEKFRFLMMAKDNAFSDYYSNRNLTKAEFYSVADTVYDLNNLWMLSGFIRQNRQVLFQEIQTSMDGLKRPDFTETCKFGKDTMLSRMFQVMENFRFNDCMVAEGTGLGYSVATRRMKAYAFTTKSGKNVPQIILQGNWVEQWGFEAGCSVSVECYQNKLVILKD